MTNVNFMTEEGFTTIKTMHRLRKVLQREGQNYQSQLFKQCGLGLTAEQFDNILKKLAASGWCTLQEGALGATMVILNEQVRDACVPQGDSNEQSY
jgi:hypothetical protein